MTTNDPAIADHVELLRDHGRRGKCEHVIEGFNGRLDAIQAGMLSVKLRHLEAGNARRRERAEEYDAAFRELSFLKTIALRDDCVPVRHLYVVRVTARDQLREALQSANIATGMHYPIPLHLQTCYQRLGLRRGMFPVAESASEEGLSLPLFPDMTPQDLGRVIAAVREFGEMSQPGLRKSA